MRFPLFFTSLVTWFPLCSSSHFLLGAERLEIRDLRSGFKLTVNPVSTTTHVCTIKVSSLYRRGSSTGDRLSSPSNHLELQ
jgi:hypothetical protein